MSDIGIHNRIDVLRDVFAYSLSHQLLTEGQRICLNQERAAWLKVLDILQEQDPDRMPEPFYRIPDHLSEKVDFILQKIKDQKWKKPETQWT